jgi:RNA polymerase sigma-70 factor (ECF subfamily)
MANRLNGDAFRWLDALDREGALAQVGDGPLLERFLAQPGPAGEAAFEVLVRRHGPMVLSVCHGVLRDGHDADDAFQATFLVLARRASMIRDRDHLAPWLGRVARRIALSGRKQAMRRNAHERRAIADEREAAPAASDLVGLETASLVRAEVDRLPAEHRRLLHLTYGQGKSYEEAAALLSWPVGTVRSRLSRARERLRGRLARLGLAPALAIAGSVVSPRGASAAQPAEALVLRTAFAAARSAGEMTVAVEAGAVPASVAALPNGELGKMATLPWKSTAALLVLGGAVTAGAGALAVRGAGEPAAPAAASIAPALAPPEARPASQAKAGDQEKAATKDAEGRSLLVNGSIEDGERDSPASWTAGDPVTGVELIWSRQGHNGKASLCLKKRANRYIPIAQWSQTVDHRGKGPRLKVSAWVKADGVTKAILDAQFLGNFEAGHEWQHAWVVYIGQKESGDPLTTHDWKRYEGVVEIPKGTKRLVVAPQIYGPGTIWFDDLEAEYTDAPAIDPTRP